MNAHLLVNSLLIASNILLAALVLSYVWWLSVRVDSLAIEIHEVKLENHVLVHAREAAIDDLRATKVAIETVADGIDRPE